MLKKIDHIGIAVTNLQKGIELYQGILGMEPEDIIEFPSEKVKIAFFPCGESSIELLEPTSEDSAIARFLSRKGEGIHHICYRVENLAVAMQNLKDRGLRALDEVPRQGAHHTKVCFFHPKDTQGVLIELSEKV